MHNENNPLDELLRRKVDEAEFSFEEKDWESMSKLLDEENKKPSSHLAKKWLALLVGFIVLSVTSYFAMKEKSPSQSSHTSVALHNTEADTDSTKSVPYTTTYDRSTTPQISENHPKNNRTKNVTKVKKTSTLSVENPIASKSSIADEQNVGDLALAQESESGIKSTTTSNEIITANSGAVTSQSKKSKNRKRSTKAIASKNTSINQKTAKSPNEADYRNTQIADKLANHQDKHSMPLKEVLGKKVIAKDTQILYRALMTADEMKNYNPRYREDLINYKATYAESITVVTYKPVQANSLLSDTIKSEILDSNQKSNSSTYNMFFAGGLMFYKGFMGNIQNGRAFSTSPYIMLGVERSLTRRITMAAQIGFTSFNGLNTLKNYTSYQYGFGVDSNVVEIQHQRLIQVLFPISIRYQLSPSHQVLMTAGISYHPDVQSNVRKQATTVSNQWGYMQGISSSDAFLQIGYLWNIDSRFGVQAIYHQGVRDITSNNYFSKNQNDKLSGFSLGFRYNFKR